MCRMRWSRFFGGVFLVLAANALGACGSESGGGGGGYDSARVTEIVALTGDAEVGQLLYQDNCQRCHGSGNGLGGEGSARSVVSTMLQGPDSMPSFSDLTDQELADLAAYVNSL